MSDREARLWELSRRLVSGEMTAQEEQEYHLLQEEQSAESNQARTELERKRFKWSLKSGIMKAYGYFRRS